MAIEVEPGAQCVLCSEELSAGPDTLGTCFAHGFCSDCIGDGGIITWVRSLTKDQLKQRATNLWVLCPGYTSENSGNRPCILSSANSSFRFSFERIREFAESTPELNAIFTAQHGFQEIEALISRAETVWRRRMQEFCDCLGFQCPGCGDLLEPRPDACTAKKCCVHFCFACFQIFPTSELAHEHVMQAHNYTSPFLPPQTLMECHKVVRTRKLRQYFQGVHPRIRDAILDANSQHRAYPEPDQSFDMYDVEMITSIESGAAGNRGGASEQEDVETVAVEDLGASAQEDVETVTVKDLGVPAQEDVERNNARWAEKMHLMIDNNHWPDLANVVPDMTPESLLVLDLAFGRSILGRTIVFCPDEHVLRVANAIVSRAPTTVRRPGQHGHLPLHEFVFRAAMKGIVNMQLFVDLFNILEEKGASVQARSGNNNKTPIQIAAELFENPNFSLRRSSLLQLSAILRSPDGESDYTVPESFLVGYDLLSGLHGVASSGNWAQLRDLILHREHARSVVGVLFRDSATLLQVTLLGAPDDIVTSVVRAILPMVDANAPQDTSGLCTLHLFIFRVARKGFANPDLIKLLVENNVNVNALSTPQNRTPLQVAAELYDREENAAHRPALLDAGAMLQLHKASTSSVPEPYLERVRARVAQKTTTAAILHQNLGSTYRTTKNTLKRVCNMWFLLIPLCVGVAAILFEAAAQRASHASVKRPLSCDWEPLEGLLPQDKEWVSDLKSFRDLDLNCDGALGATEVSRAQKRQPYVHGNLRVLLNKSEVPFSQFRKHMFQVRQKEKETKELFALETEKDCQLQRLSNYYYFVIPRTSSSAAKAKDAEAVLSDKCLAPGMDLAAVSKCSNAFFSKLERKYGKGVPEVECK